MITTELIHALSPADRRVFNRPEAASYIGASVGYFNALVKAGAMPSPLPLTGVKRWDKHALDRALDDMSGTSALPESPYDKWERTRGQG